MQRRLLPFNMGELLIKDGSLRWKSLKSYKWTEQRKGMSTVIGLLTAHIFLGRHAKRLGVPLIFAEVAESTKHLKL